MQFDYSEYREVGGVRMPFHIVNTWTDGQNMIVLKDVQPNAAVEAARFTRPAPYKAK